uniref:RNA helicase n=1 Tax=Glossina brevipalpis TaxID=37001 RepID=A0A1A9X289_9MUSC
MSDWEESDGEMPTGKAFTGSADKSRPSNNSDNEEEDVNKNSCIKSGRFGGSSRGGGGGGRGRGRALSDSHGSHSFDNRYRSGEADSNASSINFNFTNVPNDNEPYHNETFASIPKDFKRDTVLHFMQKVPEILKSSNLLQKYAIFVYIIKAYGMYLDEMKQARSIKSDIKFKTPHLEKTEVINVEEVQKEFMVDVMESRHQESNLHVELLNRIVSEDEDKFDIIDIHQKECNVSEVDSVRERKESGLDLPLAASPLLSITDIIREDDVSEGYTYDSSAMLGDHQAWGRVAGAFSSVDPRLIWPPRRPRILRKDEYNLSFPLPKYKIQKPQSLQPCIRKSIATTEFAVLSIEDEFVVEGADSDVVIEDNRPSTELSGGHTFSSSIPVERHLPSSHLIGSFSLKLPTTIKDSDQNLTEEHTQDVNKTISMIGAARYGYVGFHKNDVEGNDRGRGCFNHRSRGGSASGRREYDSRHENKHNRNQEEGEDGGAGEPQKVREFYIPPEPTDNEEEIFGSGICSGINFSKYENIPVKVNGQNPPATIQTFEDARLRDIVLTNITRSGYKVPTPIQKTAIPAIANGRDIMACAQTGSGKTAAFLIPIINQLLNDNSEASIGRPHALVVSPTRELAIQIYHEARKFALGSYLNIPIVYGGSSSKYQSENMSKGSCYLLISTGAFITFEDIRFVVLDEADRMLDMGFKDSVATIMNHPTMRNGSQRQNLMFPSTFPEHIQRMAGEYLDNYIFIAIGVVGGACADVTQRVYEVEKYQKRNKLMEILQDESEGTIVFVDTKRGADFLASLLSETEYPTTSIHGSRLQRQRETALADFKAGRMKVLIATSVAARGLDIRNVKHVVNYDMPSCIDEYVHRIGRTGRVGNSGKASSFFDPQRDAAIAGDLVKILEGAEQEVPQFLKRFSCAGGGGSSHSHNSRFGGRDYRKDVAQNEDHFITSAGPTAFEEDEDWN